jgi:hypothetical protein
MSPVVVFNKLNLLRYFVVAVVVEEARCIRLIKKRSFDRRIILSMSEKKFEWPCVRFP